VALAEFHRVRGVYPDSLAELVPAFLAADRLSESGADGDRPFGYVRDTTGYTLRFEYHGPGMNHCEFHPGGVGWSCGGYF